MISVIHLAEQLASKRIPIMLVADDQILPESCPVRAQLGADIASTWALHTGQQYHVATPEKTAVLLVGPSGQLDLYSQHPIVLSGVSVPGTLLKKWVGVLWDCELTFIPFLEDMIKVARAAFRPLCALARDGLAPLAEVGSAMRAKVDSALFYGSMFLFLVPEAQLRLVNLQFEFERCLLGAPKWLPEVLLRSSGGWEMSWGDQLIYDALAFLAELWCCEASMLVRTVWSAAQEYQGRTFAWASRQSLLELQLPEIFDCAEWSAFLRDGTPALAIYKSRLKIFLCARSIQLWKATLVSSSSAQPAILSWQFPCSAGARLLAAGFLSSLVDADALDSFRLYLGVCSALKNKSCPLCGSSHSGHAHVLAVCPAVMGPRCIFLSSVDSVFASRLEEAPPGDWPTAILNPHLDIQRLIRAVRYTADIMDALRLH